MDKENEANLFNGGWEVIFFLVSYYSTALIPGSIALMLSWSPAPSGNLSSFLAGFLLHPAPASLKENKTSDTYSNNAIADQQSIYTMVT